MTNAERQKRYRQKHKKRYDRPKSVTPVLENVTDSTPDVTENPIPSECSRESKISTPETPILDSEPETRIASIEDYHANREDYAERACAELLNWGPLMDEGELKEARLSGNRVTLPGDWDYDCKQVVDDIQPPAAVYEATEGVRRRNRDEAGTAT